jgi:hypothetical protein
MKLKFLNLALILTSFLGYLEWGGQHRMFLFQLEGEILSKFFSDPMSVMHPFVVLPLIGQLLLLFTLFQHRPNKILTYIGIGCIGILLAFLLLFIGIMSLQYKTLLSTLPFLVLAVWTIRENRKAAQLSNSNQDESTQTSE